MIFEWEGTMFNLPCRTSDTQETHNLFQDIVRNCICKRANFASRSVDVIVRIVLSIGVIIVVIVIAIGVVLVIIVGNITLLG